MLRPPKGPWPATGGRAPPEPRETARAVLLEYARDATVHGLRYVVRPGAAPIDRLCWIATVVASAAFAAYMIHSALTKFAESPTVTVVETTHFPLHRLPFPAVTVCPTDRVKRADGEQLLTEYLGLSRPLNRSMQNDLSNVMIGIAKLIYPYYVDVTPHLTEVQHLLPALENLNLTSFMLKVLPTCKELFKVCIYKGMIIDCCKEFHLQPFEGGFCYSFNSETSVESSYCARLSGAARRRARECRVRHNAAAGPTTGLELLLSTPPEAQRLNERQRMGRGLRVMLHAPDQFPEVGRGALVLRREGHRARAMLQVVPGLTGSTAAVRALPPARRACYFPEERALPAGAAYSQVACLLDCRLTHIRRVCGCVPYFFSAAFPDVNTCNVSGVLCIGREHVALRFFSPPGAPLKAAEEKDGPALNCSQCLPSCSNSRYSVEVLSWHQTVQETSVANPQFNACDAYVDVHFKDLSAVLYRRDVAFDDMQLLVSFGGITGLFLGVSLLSAVEVGYFALRLLAAAARAARAALGGAPRPPLAHAHSHAPAHALDPPAPPLYAWLP